MTRKRNRVVFIFMVFISGLIVSGCASVVSKGLLRDVDKTLSPSTIQAAADAKDYEGRRVVWGGLIVGLTHSETSTLVEVFSTPLDSTHRPTGRVLEGSASSRFLIESEGFLDEIIYSKGSGITVVGVVKGIRKKKIDEMEYPYPLLTPIEIRIFDMMVKESYDSRWDTNWPPYYPYGGYYGHYPYNAPYWPSPYNRYYYYPYP
ncbi:MAG: Slp family lipoprotein [Deltaproteobacteria bacterium]|nr:Slp family lipoprotein [Deltaproteobacteria bacterium]